MILPTIIVQASDLTIHDTALFTRGSAVEFSVNTVSVVIFFKQKQFPLQIMVSMAISSSSSGRKVVEPWAMRLPSIIVQAHRLSTAFARLRLWRCAA